MAALQRHPQPAAEAAGKASPARATMLTLGLLLGGLEATLNRTTWRYATTAQQEYFTALQRSGYALADVEHLVITPAGDDSGTNGDPAAPGEPSARSPPPTGSAKPSPAASSPTSAGSSRPRKTLERQLREVVTGQRVDPH